MSFVNAAFAVGTIAVGYMATSSANGANAQMSAMNRDSAVVSQMYENRGLNAQQRQQDEVSSDKRLAAKVKALSAASTARASARNIGGVSVQRSQQDATDALSRVLGQLDANSRNSRISLKMQKLGTTAKATGRINSVPKITRKYDPTADIIKGGLSIYGGYQGYKDTQAKLGNKDVGISDYAFGDWLK